jgi:hypothetical protein
MSRKKRRNRAEGVSATETVYPLPVIATVKLNEVMPVLIVDETVRVRIALTEAPADKL